MAADHDLLFPCACHGNHFLRISWWDDSPEQMPDMDLSGYMSIVGDFGLVTFMRRLRNAVSLLRHGHANTVVEMMLSADDCRKAAQALMEYADAEDQARRERASRTGSQN